MKAVLKNVRISTRKLNLAVKMVRRKKVVIADTMLKFAKKKAADILRKVVNSAAANAVVQGEIFENLYISEIELGPGETLKRWQPRARGSSYRILKRSSNLRVVLSRVDPNLFGTPVKSPKSQSNTEEEEKFFGDHDLESKVRDLAEENSGEDNGKEN